MTIAGIIFIIVLVLTLFGFLYWAIYDKESCVFIIGLILTFAAFMIGLVLNEEYHKKDNPKRYEIISPERYIKDDQKFKCVVHIRSLDGGVEASLNASTKQEFELFHTDNFLIKRGHTTNMFGWEQPLGYYWFPKDTEKTALTEQK